MLDTEAFREFKQGLTLLRDNYAGRALPHMRRAMDLDKNNPYYMSYLGVVLARSEQKWGEAERLCDAAVRMKRNQAQLYLNLAEVYATAGRRDEAVEALQAGLKFARRDVRLTIAMNRLMQPQRAGALFPGATASGEPAARHAEAPRDANVRPSRIIQIHSGYNFLHPKQEERRPGDSGRLFFLNRIFDGNRDRAYLRGVEKP